MKNIYDQQEKMYKDHTHSVEKRIVNIYQPYVRPIVRGKDKANVEFVAKLGVSIQNGYARINTLSWEVVITDKIYGNRENRQWLKELGVRYSGKPLGRPSVKSQTAYQRKEVPQGARAARTSESWIAAIFFVMNLLST